MFHFIDTETTEEAIERLPHFLLCTGIKRPDKEPELWTGIPVLPNGVPVMHNASFDLWVLEQAGVPTIEQFEDTQLIHYLLNPSNGKHSLKECGEEYGVTKLEAPSFSEYSEELGEYCKGDVTVTEAVFNGVYPKLKACPPLFKLYEYVEKPFVRAIIEMETTGISIDTDAWHDVLTELHPKLEELKKQISEQFPLQISPSVRVKNPYKEERLSVSPLEGKFLPQGQDETSLWMYAKWVKFNPNSDIHVKNVFGTKDAQAATLENLDDPRAELLLQYAKLSKITSTYGDNILKRVRDNGRLYCSYNQCVTLTGRLSSSKTNLQNIPARGEIGDTIRKMFVSSEGHKLVGIDCDSFQMRIYAWYLAQFGETEDAFELLNNFNHGENPDPHQAKADLIGVSRTVAKTLNFAGLFGASVRKAAITAKIPIKEMQRHFDAQEKHFPSDKLLKDTLIKLCRENKGFVFDAYGRRGYYPNILAENKWDRLRAERQAFNFVIQGTEASIIKAMINEAKRVRDKLSFPAKLVLQCHDEIVFEVKEERADEWGSILESIVNRDTWLTGLNLAGKANIGDNWYEIH